MKAPLNDSAVLEARDAVTGFVRLLMLADGCGFDVAARGTMLAGVELARQFRSHELVIQWLRDTADSIELAYAPPPPGPRH